MSAFSFNAHSCPIHNRMRNATKVSRFSMHVAEPTLLRIKTSRVSALHSWRIFLCIPASGNQGCSPIMALANYKYPQGKSNDQENGDLGTAPRVDRYAGTLRRAGVLWGTAPSRSGSSSSRTPRRLLLSAGLPRRMAHWADRHSKPPRTLGGNRYWEFASSVPCPLTSDHKCEFIVLFTSSWVKLVSSANKMYRWRWGVWQ
jgi:hypothetical protein